MEVCPETVVITIDGPAGAGKSTVARELAKRLGFEFLDTGAMYRCVTLAAMRAGLATSDGSAVASLAHSLDIHLNGTLVELDGQDVTPDIRTPEVTANIGRIADNVEIRHSLSVLQRRWASGKQVVTEGRDQGTEVFPDAACKIFLTASNVERARRRVLELEQRGVAVDFDTVIKQQDQRDREDTSRPVGRLRKADDAIDFLSDGLSLNVVVDSLFDLVCQRLRSKPS